MTIESRIRRFTLTLALLIVVALVVMATVH